MNPGQPYEGSLVHQPSYPVVYKKAARLRAALGLLLITIGSLLLWLRLTGQIGGSFLNIGTVEGTIVTSERFDARNIVLDVASGDVTVVSGRASEVIVEITRRGFGWSSSTGRDVAEQLAVPTITVDGDTVRVSEHSRPGVNISIFGRIPYRHY